MPSFTLGWYAKGRDQFGHIDERIFGGTNSGKLQVDSFYVSTVPGHENLWRGVADYYPRPYFDGTHLIVDPSTWEITTSGHLCLTTAATDLQEIGEAILQEKEG